MSKQETICLSSHFQRGLQFQQQGQLEQAVAAYGRAIKLDPDNVPAYINMGSALRKLGKLDAAKLSYQRVCELRPDDTSALSNYGNVLCDMMAFSDAELVHNQVLALDGENSGFIYNAGIVPFNNNRPDEAIKFFDRVLEKEPEHLNANWNRALAYLQKGDYIKGFKGYEWRLQRDDVHKHELDKPVWKGKSLKGKTIFLTAEQGFGDMIQFVRFIPLIAKKAKSVILECQPEMFELMRLVDGVDKVVRMGEPIPDFDMHVPLLSVPHILKTTLDTLPDTVPYFNVKPAETKYIPASQHKRLRVGLVWSGKATPYDRSCDFEKLLPLMQNTKVNYYSFQLGGRRDDIKQVGAEAYIYDMGGSIRDFHDTARLMQHMDLIISIDSAAAHLAGALGLPVWVILLHSSDWRWLLNRDDSPWYPTMRLFRQTESYSWDGCLKQVEDAFEIWVAENIKEAKAILDLSTFERSQ